MRKLLLFGALACLILAALLFWGRGYIEFNRVETGGPRTLETAEPVYEEGIEEEFSAEQDAAENDAAERLAGEDAAKAGEGVSGLAEKVADAHKPVLELEARMWAHRIQGGEFTIKGLKEESRGWIVSDAYKEILFARIARLLRDGEVKPLTAEESKKLETVMEESRSILGAK